MKYNANNIRTNIYYNFSADGFFSCLYTPYNRKKTVCSLFASIPKIFGTGDYGHILFLEFEHTCSRLTYGFDATWFFKCNTLGIIAWLLHRKTAFVRMLG
mmetsp:Transcript_2735/g.2993  ORF Transcript_2735/g.2993 Transcript_2735/m.2993 type:complete len:100 (+) Transcript_2735:200-499(+)